MVASYGLPDMADTRAVLRHAHYGYRRGKDHRQGQRMNLL